MSDNFTQSFVTKISFRRSFFEKCSPFENFNFDFQYLLRGSQKFRFRKLCSPFIFIFISIFIFSCPVKIREIMIDSEWSDYSYTGILICSSESIIVGRSNWEVVEISLRWRCIKIFKEVIGSFSVRLRGALSFYRQQPIFDPPRCPLIA